MTTAIRSLVADQNGMQVWITGKQLETLNVLEQCRGGLVAGVHGYVPTTGYEVSPVKDMQILTRFSYANLLRRRQSALEAIELTDIPADTVPANKLKGKTLAEWFAERKAQELVSMQKTLDGDRSDAHREGHDRCYARFVEGIKCHLKTVKGNDGLMHPVLENGFPVVESIMVQHLVLNTKTIKEGVYKTINSGASVMVKNAIERVLNSRSVKVKSISLKEDNFDKLVIDHNTIVPSDLY